MRSIKYSIIFNLLIAIFGSVAHLLHPVDHVHVDDGGEDGEDGAIGDHGAGSHVRSVAHGLLHALVHCAALKGSKAPDVSGWLLGL